MRPFLDDSADLFEEGSTSLNSTWPTSSRRRHLATEWDDYIELYGSLDCLQERGYRVITPQQPETPVEELTCLLCDHVAPTKRGLSVHLSKRHDVASPRAAYYASRKEKK